MSTSRRKSHKKTASGTKGQILSHTSPTNWFAVELWPAINKAAKSCQFCMHKMVKILQSGVSGNVYGPLKPGTISHWIARDDWGENLWKWKDSILTKVANGGSRDITVPWLGCPRAMVIFCCHSSHLDSRHVVRLGFCLEKSSIQVAGQLCNKLTEIRHVLEDRYCGP